MTITRIKKEDLKHQKGDTDWERARQLSDEEIREAAKSDPDSSLPTDEELKEFKRRSDVKND
jgi:hypothetical protein